MEERGYPRKIAELPEDWKQCLGTYRALPVAIKLAETWNGRNDEYYYKVFYKFRNKNTTYIIAKKLKSEM